MTGAHDETDAAFVDRQIQEHEEYVQATGERNAEYERVLEIARTHAVPRTVQAGVSDQGMAAIRELVMLVAEEHGGLPGDACANEFDQDSTATNITEDGDIVPGKITFGHIRRAVAALEAAASVLLSPAACSCGGVAWQPIETAPKSTPILVSYIIAFNEPVTGMAVCWFHHEKWCGGPADILQFRALAWMPLPTVSDTTQSTPCACYRAGIERAAEIAEGSWKKWHHPQTISCPDAAFARAIASDIRRAGEEGSR